MDGGDHGAIERGIQLAPLAGRHDSAGREAERFEHPPDDDWIGREHFAEQRDFRQVSRVIGRALDGAGEGLLAGIGEHGASQHIFRFRMRRHAEARHINADDPHTVDLIGEQSQRHTGSGRHAEIGDHDRVVERRISGLLDGFLDVLEQLAGDQRFGIERHIADRALGAVEVRGECQAIDAASRARENRCRAAHAQADAE